MYRRLKNILGVSFIIFAIVLAQIPMESVLAVEDNEIEETISENTESNDTENEAVVNGEDDISLVDDTVSDDTTLMNDDTSTNSNTPTNDSGTDNDSQADDGNTAATSIPSSMKMVITYKAPNATKNETQTIEVEAGSLIPQPDPLVTVGFELPFLKGYRIDGWHRTNEDGSLGEIIDDWNITVIENMTITAHWEPLKYNVTFNMNGGYFADVDNQSVSYVATADYGTSVEDVYPDEDKITHDNTEVRKVEDVWYTDRQCLNEFSSTIIESDIELFKRWYIIVEQDFHISEDGTILYKYDGSGLKDVVIPSSVTKIAAGAFSDMSSIESITLPDYISYISTGAFGSANGRKIELYAVSSQAKEEAVLLASSYDYFVYKESQEGDIANTVNIERNSSLYDSNAATGSVGLNSYVKVVGYPNSMKAGNYTMSFLPNEDSSSDLHKLVSGKLKVTDSNRTYYMHINLNTSTRAAYTKYRENEFFKISLPLPESWQKRKELTKSGAVQVYTILYDSEKLELELLENTEVVNDSASGLYCVRFSTWHFSEYVIVYDGSMELINSGTGTGGNSGNTNTGGNNSGSSGNGGNSSSDSGSSGGSSSSGGSGTGNSGNTGSGNNSASSSTNTSVVPTTPVTTTPALTLPTTPGNIGTQPVVTPTGTSTGSGKGNTHVKDSTPKTGDPLEYKTLLVCMFFSLGILMLCVGNKKNTQKHLQNIS